MGERIVTNLRYAVDIILLATSEAELQELVDRLDRVSRKYSLHINVDKTKVMASDVPVRTGRTDRHLRPALLGRLCRRVDLKTQKMLTKFPGLAASGRHNYTMITDCPKFITK